MNNGRVFHKGYKSENGYFVDRTNVCWDVVSDGIKSPQFKATWKCVTCKQCLRMKRGADRRKGK